MLTLSLFVVTIGLAAAMLLKSEFETTPVEKRVNRALKRAVRDGLPIGETRRTRRFSRHDMLPDCDAGTSRAASSPVWA